MSQNKKKNIGLSPWEKLTQQAGDLRNLMGRTGAQRFPTLHMLINALAKAREATEQMTTAEGAEAFYLFDVLLDLAGEVSAEIERAGSMAQNLLLVLAKNSNCTRRDSPFQPGQVLRGLEPAEPQNPHVPQNRDTCAGCNPGGAQ